MDAEAPDRTPAQKWKYIATVCGQAAKTVPSRHEPSVDNLSAGDEWKIAGERQAIEGDCWQETEEILEHWLEKEEWPKVESYAGFFVRERLEWAGSIAELLSTVPTVPEVPEGISDFTDVSARDVIRWLAIDVYSRGIAAPRRWYERAMDDLHH